MVKSLPLALLIAVGLLSSTLTSKASDMRWSFDALGSDFSLSGTITGTALGNGSYKTVSGSGTFGAGLFSGTEANLFTFTTPLDNYVGYDGLTHGIYITAGLWKLAAQEGEFGTGQALYPYAPSVLDYVGFAFSFTRAGQPATIFLWNDTANYKAYVMDDFNNVEQGSSNLTNYWAQGGETISFTLTNPTTVPEPSTYGLIGIAALGVAFVARRRKIK